MAFATDVNLFKQSMKKNLFGFMHCLKRFTSKYEAEQVFVTVVYTQSTSWSKGQSIKHINL